MGKLQYSLAVSSKVPLRESVDLGQQAYVLGQKIATKGHVLLTPVGLNLAYQVAAGMSHKTGLSLGFSPASDLRYHVADFHLPTDVYDWLYFGHRSETALLNELIRSSQALILIGAVLNNMSELAQALDLFLPVGILLDNQQQSNNALLPYLNSLPREKQQRIVVHQQPEVLLDTLCHILEINHKELDEKILNQNNQDFKQLLTDLVAKTSAADNQSQSVDKDKD